MSADRIGLGGGGEEVYEEAVGSGDGFGELAVEGEGAVGPAALADWGGEESATLGELRGGFGASGIVGFEQGGVVGVPGAQEAVAALLDPVVEVGGGDAVGGGEEGVGGGEELDGVGFVYNLFGVAAKGEGIGGVSGCELRGLELDEDVAAVAGVVEEGLSGRAVKVGVGGVGADTEDDRGVLSEIGGGKVGYGEDRRGEAEGGEGFGVGVAGAGEVGDVRVRWEVEIDGDDAGGRWRVVVGEDEAGLAYGPVAVGVGVVVGGLGCDVEELGAGEGGGGVEVEVDGVGGGCGGGWDGLGLQGPVVGGLDVDVGGGGCVSAEGGGEFGLRLGEGENGCGGGAGDGDGRDDGDGLRAVVDDAAEGDLCALIGDGGPCGERGGGLRGVAESRVAELIDGLLDVVAGEVGLGDLGEVAGGDRPGGVEGLGGGELRRSGGGEVLALVGGCAVDPEVVEAKRGGGGFGEGGVEGGRGAGDEIGGGSGGVEMEVEGEGEGVVELDAFDAEFVEDVLLLVRGEGG